MPELRHDPISDRWVIIAGNRHGRPEEFRPEAAARVEIDCPFCRGHEHQATPAVATYGPTGALLQNWEVRVITNLYPALAEQEIDSPQGRGVSRDDAAEEPELGSLAAALLSSRPGAGRHEVVIESPHHVESTSELSDDQAFWTFLAYRDRLREFSDQFAAASVFKNCGPDGGASLVHAHSQILMLPHVPENLARELAGFASFRRRHDVCVLCAMADREAQLGDRLVAQTERFVVWCPYASRFAYETWIAPRIHAARFEAADENTLREGAKLLKRVIRAVEDILERPAFNYFLHTSPFDTFEDDHYHWHIEVFPRISKAAGFEWGAGWHLNAVPPELAAAALRDAISP